MKVLFACGGTAGHVNPAVAVAGKLKEMNPENEFLFIGAEGKMEMNLVPREGYEIRSVKITNLSRGKNLKAIGHNLQTVKNTISSVGEAKKILREFAPDVVVGTGGYVCYPVIRAAHSLGIPTAIHESNAVPGLTTKLLAKKADCVMVGMEESAAYYGQAKKVVVTGTPVRMNFACYSKEEAKREMGLPEDMPLVLSVWGSLGAGHMNAAMTEIIPALSQDKRFHLIHSAGSGYYKGMMQKLEGRIPQGENCRAEVKEYIYDMPRVMAAADLVMCRAGASTLAELTYLGKPAIIVPSPNVTNNHQEKNARVLERAGGAKVLLEGEFTPESFRMEMEQLLGDPERLQRMSEGMRACSIPDAADKMTEIVLDLAGKRQN